MAKWQNPPRLNRIVRDAMKCRSIYSKFTCAVANAMNGFTRIGCV